ncbi:MAG: helicase [Myxococcales bacterium FL481]|nr:MAG: helicase [Myxococcales bacterium FL481]
MADPHAPRDGVSALLGPTNTGKTHRAVERMLDYDTGMLGVPLRLLARELYERISARIGEARVGLLTGEEKRLPVTARYFVCTTESMPLDRDVDFVAVDEIQLASHRQRGHIFTSRLLYARGRCETWFLGSTSAEPIVRELVPTAKIVDHPRFSVLRDAGQCSLGRLAPRSAVVAFSAAEVYRLAERVRQRHGGVAVVLGALSPRTRNAQVDLYQSGEVRHIVATDAIGMGLNMEIDHVAFAGLRKFDGTGDRLLHPAELAQIAGRAGRYRNDGSFGTLAPQPRLEPAVARAIEEHRFRPLSQVQWRNEDLDFRSVERLAVSLRRPPPRRCLVLPDNADDEQALRWLSARASVRARCNHPDDVELLWELCQVPDYQKLLVDHHVELLEELFVQLTESTGRLADDWLAEQLRPLDDTSGGIDRLMARLGFVRTWTFITHRRNWVRDPPGWQARTRELEDRLSDALHEALIRRFVATTATRTDGASKTPARARPEPSLRGDAWHQPLAALAELSPAVDTPREASDAEFFDAVEHADDAAFELDRTGAIVYSIADRPDRRLATLAPGRDWLTPQVLLCPSFELPGGQRARVTRRLTTWLRDQVRRLFSPLFDAPTEDIDDRCRGLLYELAQAAGALSRRQVDRRRQRLGKTHRAWLRRRGITFGDGNVYVRRAWQRDALALRWTLTRVFFPPLPPQLRFAARSIADCRQIPDQPLAALGYARFGRVALRVDHGDRLLSALRRDPPQTEQTLAAVCQRSVGLAPRRLREFLRHWKSPAAGRD